MVKGCDSRGVVELLQENLINREDVVVFGMGCNGTIDINRVLAKIGDVTEAAYFIRDEVLPKMDTLRAPADEAERFTAAEYWPFPTYGDLLFGVK